MSIKTQILKDYLDSQRGLLIFEVGIPTESLQEAVKHPDKLRAFLGREVAEALDSFITQKELSK